jgi:carbon-monoxide dehydrogenase large subunit
MPTTAHRMNRLEDEGLLRGLERFSGDMQPPGGLTAMFIRSSYAHARIISIDIDDARCSPGTVAIFTGDELGVGPVYLSATTAFIPPDFAPPAVATGVVRYVGEILGVVIAESAAAAADALDLVVVDYEPLAPALDLEAASAADASLVFPQFGTNVAVDIPFEAGEPLDGDLVRIELRNINQRMAVSPIEPNAITAVPDSATGRATMWVANQMPHLLRDNTAAQIGMDPADLRVITPAVGGSFGGKIPAEKEYALVLAAACRLGRPITFVQQRRENLMTMHGRGSVQHVVLEATREGKLSSMRADLQLDGGAYPGIGIGLSMTTRGLLPGVYHLPHLAVRIRGIATNTAPVGSYRGAGRPEAVHLTERAMDRMAVELGLDPVELRRRNLIGPGEFPFASMTGYVYDSGDYERCLDEAVRLSDYHALREEQARRRTSGDSRALGIGIAMYVEVSAGLQMFFDQYGSAEIGADGGLTLVVGTAAHGQGHVTTYTQIAHQVLGIATDRITVVQGDTGTVPSGVGTGGSSSGQMGGNAVHAASVAVLDKARELAAHLLEAAIEDLELVDGVGLGVRGSPNTTLTWAELAIAALDDDRRPEHMPPGLHEAPGFHQEGGTFPFGCHVAVVEVDLELGAVELVRMIAVDDCGNVLHPTIVAGQVHGGLAAGISHALFEEVRYDNNGNPLTTTFADYALPSAAEFPSFEVHHTTTPSPRNPLGVKGIGEAGTTGSTAAVHNAVVDALGHLGIDHIELPLTPERVWTAIQATAAPR